MSPVKGEKKGVHGIDYESSPYWPMDYLFKGLFVLKTDRKSTIYSKFYTQDKCAHNYTHHSDPTYSCSLLHYSLKVKEEIENKIRRKSDSTTTSMKIR